LCTLARFSKYQWTIRR